MRHAWKLGTAAALAAATLTFSTAAGAQDTGMGKSMLHWGPAPDAFPAGAKMAIEKGDPMKAEMFTVRMSFPAGYKIPPHWHPTDEHVRVVKGEFLVGMGDTLDESKAMKITPGDTVTMGATQHHFAIARTAAEVSVRAMGPFAMTYVNPADDPRKKR